MATNKVQDGKVLTLEIASTESGDPVSVGSITGVALTDTDDNGNVEVDTEGVYALDVVGNDGSEGAAVSAGDAVYIDSGTINVDSSKTLFGYALEAVSSGETTEIDVLLA